MRHLVLISVVIIAGCSTAAPPRVAKVEPNAATSAETKVETEEQKTLYSLGYAVADNLKPFNLTAAEFAIVKSGFADGVQQKKPTVDPHLYYGKIRELQTVRLAEAATKEKEAGAAYLEKASKENGATKLPSGMVIATVKEGTGPSPTATDTVKVHYHGTLTSGKVFDSSVDRNEPAVFPLNGVIPCWTEGVQKIKVGGKAKLVCPPELAYGQNGAGPDIGPGATLVFEVELLEIVKGQ